MFSCQEDLYILWKIILGKLKISVSWIHGASASQDALRNLRVVAVAGGDLSSISLGNVPQQRQVPLNFESFLWVLLVSNISSICRNNYERILDMIIRMQFLANQIRIFPGGDEFQL